MDGISSSYIGQIWTKLDNRATDNAVKMTRLRFEINNLNGNIKKMDAENLKYNNSTFDYVVSWGVIHHSGNMEKIVANIHKVLSQMKLIWIYNKNSLVQMVLFFWLGIFKLKFLKLSFDECWLNNRWLYCKTSK